MRSRHGFRIFGFAVVALAVAAAAVGAAVSSSGAGVVTTAKAQTAGAAVAPACIPKPPTNPPRDPNKVVPGLSALAKKALGGYPGAVYKSPWVNFKPSHGPPWKVGFSNNQASLYGSAVLSGIKKVKGDNPGKISTIVALTPATPNDVATQIQQMRLLLQQNVDIIFALLSSPTALNAVIDEAAAKNVPVISIAGQSTSKNAINLQPNTAQLGYYGAAGVMTAMGTPGDLLMVRAIPAITYDQQVTAGATRVLRACKVPVIGSVNGFFDPATAKAETLKFLAGHPGEIKGVFQVSGMAPGVIGAFEQVGRKVPPVADVNPGAASLLYWKKNAPEYKGSGVAIVPRRTGEYTMSLGFALLKGRGVRITDVPFTPPVIATSTLSSWIDPSWTESSAAQANGPDKVLPIKALVDSYTVRK